MFFDSEIADTLQYFTLPIEMLGLFLASIEVRFPSTAKRIGDSMHRQWQLVSKRTNREVSATYLWLVSLLILPLLFALETAGLFTANLPTTAKVGIFLFFIALAANVTALRFVPGREVGTIGIVIAGVGVLGEGYQFGALVSGA